MSSLSRSVKTAAHVRLNKAIKDGLVCKPSSCSICNKTPKKLNGHHDDYAYPLDVRWMCTKCHLSWHRENGPGLNAGVKVFYPEKALVKPSPQENRTRCINIKRSIKISLAIAGMERGELAKRSGVNPAHISVISSKNICTLATLKKLAKSFDIKVSTFIERGE